MGGLATRQSARIALFNVYSYSYNVLFAVLEFLPQPLRRVVFKLLFKKLGRGGFLDYKTYFRYPSKISIGNYTGINRGCGLYGSSLEGVEIIIGNHVSLGPDVRILTAGHEYSTFSLADTAATVRLGDHVWVGAGSIILPGVTIGEGAVIGAGSVVPKDIEPFMIAVGNPARAIKKRQMQQVATPEASSRPPEPLPRDA